MTVKHLPYHIFKAVAILWMLSASSLFGQNVLTHGNFDDNILDFNTDYEYSWGLGGDGDVGKYCVSPNARSNSTSMFDFTDHTSGAGLYMVVNGATVADQLVWGMTVNVQAHSYYDLSLWMTNLSRLWVPSVQRSKIRVKINGATVVNEYYPTNTPTNAGAWNQMPSYRWYSANSSTANIQIYDICTTDNGNDFGLDDISFTYVYSNVVEAVEDELITCFETPAQIDPMQNDNISPNSIRPDVHFTLVSQPSHGSLSLVNGTTHTYTYTPNTGYSGNDSFSYKLTYGTNDITSYGFVSITVNARPQRVITQHACEEYTWSYTGQTYTQSGQYQHIKTNPNGCDSLLILNLTIHHGEEVTLDPVEECDEYTWHGTTYTQSGNYDYTTTTEWGCTRLEHLPLTIHYSDTLSIPVSACESYTWYGQTYSQSGTYDHLTTNSFGCTRLEQLELTISEEFRQVDILTECDAYFWPRKNQWYYQDVLDSVPVPGPPGGCDSTFVLDLTIHYGDTIDVDPVTACDSYEWHGETYTTSGIKTYLTTNEFGCDRLERLDLTINNSESIELPAVTACDVFSWHGQDYTQSGLVVFDTVNQNNCPLQYTLPLTILHSDTLDWEPVTECDSYIWFGQTITESGQYERWTTNPDNCDRLERIYVTINYSTIDTLDPVTACDSYEWHGQEYTQTGYYSFEEEGPTGCPHTEVLLLTINHSSEKELDVTACESYEWYDSIYYEPGTYYHVLPNSQGCDSLLILHLQIGETFEFEESATGCESYEWHGQTYFESGYYEYPVDNPEGCDSLFILHLTIASNYEEEIEAESCYSYTWIDEVYDESGDYPRHFTAITGCDSLVVLHLTIKEAILHEFEQQTCQPYEWNGITYYEDGYYEQTFDASNGCDSIATMHLVFSDALTSEFDRTACDFITWEEHLCDHEGDYSHTYQSIQGCDSIVTMHFSLTDAFINEFDTLACEPFQWFEYDCQQDGTISHNFITSMGCDSTVIKHVTLNHPESSTQFIAACDSYVYNGVVYDEPGVFFIDTDTLFNQSGCDSIVFHIRLEIKDSEQIGLISGLSNVYVASNLINGIYRYEVDPEEVQGSIEWTLSDSDWQIVEAQENYCLVLVSTPVTATLTAHFRTSECGVIDRDFVINAGFFGVEDQSLDVKVFPNPTQGTVTIEAEGIESLRLCDMLGQVLETHDSGRADHVTLYLNTYQPAVYLLEIKTINGTVKKRLMLCR